MPFTFEDAHAWLIEHEGPVLALCNQAIEEANNGDSVLSDVEKAKLETLVGEYCSVVVGILGLFSRAMLAEQCAEGPPEL